MKHIKKHRGIFTRREQDAMSSLARQKVKTILSRKYKTEYDTLLKKFYRAVKRKNYKLKEDIFKNDD